MTQSNPIHKLVDEFRAEYLAFTAVIVKKINDKVQSGISGRIAVDQVFKSEKVVQTIQTMVQQKVVESAAIGYGVDKLNNEKEFIGFFNSEFGLSDQISNAPLKPIIKEEIRIALKKGRTYIQIANRLEGKNLITAEIPKYLNDFLGATKKNISDAELRKEIARTAKKLNRLALNGAPNNRLKAAYAELVEKAISGSEKELEKSIRIAVQEKSRYNAERIARTELARSNGIAHDFKAINDNDVIGVEYNLSNRHKIYDICDFHTSANLYGMGPGIYPKDRHPRYPFHPHCTCVPNEVFIGEAEIGEFKPKEGANFIKSQTKDQKKSLLGVKGVKKFNKGGNWQDNLNNWQGQDKITLDGLKKTMFE